MLRNKEFQKFSILFLLMAAVFAMVGFVINVYAGILSIISSAVFGIVFFMFTKSRYKSIAKISDEIDLVLHNDDHLYITESNEGELSILQSEIRKMTLRIREQNDALKKKRNILQIRLQI